MVNLSYSQVLVLAYFVLFLVFFAVSLYIPKRAGKDPKGTKGGYPKGKTILGILSGVPFFSLIVLYIMNEKTVEWFWDISVLDNEYFHTAGLVLMGLGLLIELTGILTLGENFRVMLPADNTELITHGIYQYVRHPIGLSVMVYVTGLFLVVPNMLALLNLVWNVLFYNDKATFEEYYLLKAHNQYRSYMNRVGKFFPKITKGP
jgi:protein-S-isoprenylcysteine O-methyltransferase Ste14